MAGVGLDAGTRLMPARSSRRTSPIIAGLAVSAIGDRFAGIAFALVAVQRDSPWLLAAVLVADMLPPVLFGLIGGISVDRRARWWWWPGLLLVQGACYGVLAFKSTPNFIVILVSISSTAAAIIGPVGSKLLWELAGPDGRTEVARNAASASALAGLLGTLVGGALFDSVGRNVLFLGNAASFLLLGVIGAVVARGVTVEVDSNLSAVSLTDLLVGFRRLASRSVFGGSGMAIVGAVILGTSLQGVVGAFFLLQGVGLTSTWYGAIIAAWAAGALLGTRLLGGLAVTARAPNYAISLAAVGMGLALAGSAAAPPALLLALLYILGGLCNGWFNATYGIRIMQGVPGNEQGRAWASFAMLANSAVLVGYLLGSMLGGTYSQATVLFSGLLPICIAIPTLIRLNGTPGDKREVAEPAQETTT